MTTKKFLESIQASPEIKTSFYFENEKLVPDHYHITEIKNIISESVDCGKTKHIEKSTMVQLWSSQEDIGKHLLSNQKINTIFEGIDKALGLNMDANITFEFGDEHRHTSVYHIENVQMIDDTLKVNLFVPETECKPKKLLKSLTSCCAPNCC